MSVFGQLASLLIRPEKDAGFEDTFASRFGAAPLSAEEAAALRQRQFTNRQQASGAERAERAGPAVLGGLADLSKSLGEPVTRITDYARSRVGTEAPLTEEDVFRQDLASRNIGKGVAQAGSYGLPVRNPLSAVGQLEARGGTLYAGSNKAPPTVVQGIRAYHGSPHDFDRFDLSKIGTGEGAQAYGHGLYFAENQGVARDYYNKFTPKDVIATKHRAMLEAKGGDWPATVDDIMRGYYETAKNKAAYREQLLRQGPPKAHMYEVSLNARPEQFLDWDRPLREQAITNQLPSTFLDAAKQEAYNRAIASTSKSRADQLWSMVKNPLEAPGGFAVEAAKKAPEISAALKDQGIPGIRYLDQGSRPQVADTNRTIAAANKALEHFRNPQRNTALDQNFIMGPLGTPEGAIRLWEGELARAMQLDRSITSNYVVFDPGIIDILRKYGLAGATAAPLGALAAQDNYRQ